MYKTFILYKYLMHTLSLSEFRANASAMIDRVEQGETVRILRHGKPVAELVGIKPDLSAQLPSYKRPFEPLLQLPSGYSAVKALLDERGSAPW
jgi:prevent-host-death family protein